MKRFILVRRIALYVYRMMILMGCSKTLALRRFYDTINVMDDCSTYEKAAVIEDYYWNIPMRESLPRGVEFNYAAWMAWCLAFEWKETFC